MGLLFLGSSRNCFKSSFRKMSKISYPSASRNGPFILDVIKEYLVKNKPGRFLEISSGTGEHLALFAPHFPNIEFQPSEYETSLFRSINAYASECPTKNINEAVPIDVTIDVEHWNLTNKQFDYVLNVNMVHISPFACAEGLFANVGKILKSEGVLFTYGPYAVDGVITPQSNIDFDRHLRSNDPSWGLRDIRDLKLLAQQVGMELIKIHDMPSNNKTLIWKKIKQ